MTGPAIVCDGLSKTYHSRPRLADVVRGELRGPPVTALHPVSFTVGAGECVALLGDNGAGKSTLLQCLAGLIEASHGGAYVSGIDIANGRAELRSAAAYVAGNDRAFSWRLSGRANLLFFAALYGLRSKPAAESVERVLDQAGIAPAARARRVAEYSTGMRQRLAIARGFLGSPDVWLLDEPTAGMDPRGARALLDDIRNRTAGHGAVLFATHSVEAVDRVADRALVLRDGALAHDGDVTAAIEMVTT